MEVPDRMTAAVMTGHGGPEVLEIREVPVPRPEPREVLIRVAAAGVNNTDIWTREGAYGRAGDPDAVAGWRGDPIDVPRIQGADIAGRIAAVGDQVDEARLGERVIVDPAIFESGAGDEPELMEVLGSERDGGFAEYVAVPAANAADVTGSPLDDVPLGGVPIVFGTAMGMLERADVRPGERILVTGASGGLGSALVQLAAARGATVIGLTSEGKADAVRAAGAARTIIRDAGDLTPQRVTDEAGGELDVIADVVGNGVFESVFPSLRTGGRLVTAGAVAGPEVTLDLRVLYLRKRRLIGSTMHTPAEFSKLVELVRNGGIHPIVARTYPLQEIGRAQEDLRSGDLVGKLVLLP